MLYNLNMELDKLDTFVDINKASAILGVHPQTLRRWDRDGKLPAIRQGTESRRRYKLRDLYEFMKQTGVEHEKEEIL